MYLGEKAKENTILNNLRSRRNDADKSKPIVNFAPAHYILRKRTAKSLQQVLQKIREQIR